MRMQVGGQQAFGGVVQLLPVARALQEVGKGGVGGDKGGKLHGLGRDCAERVFRLPIRLARVGFCAVLPIRPAGA